MPGPKSYLLRVPLLRRFLAPRPKPQDVIDLWDYVCARHGVSTCGRRNPDALQEVFESLHIMGVTAKVEFCQWHLLVLPMNRQVFLPFDIGYPQEVWSLWRQMVSVGHVAALYNEHTRLGDLGYAWDYLRDSEQRCRMETVANRSDLELWWRYCGRLPSLWDTAFVSLQYGCSMRDCEWAKKELEQSEQAVRTGRIIEPSSREVMAWMDERYDWSLPC